MHMGYLKANHCFISCAPVYDNHWRGLPRYIFFVCLFYLPWFYSYEIQYREEINNVSAWACVQTFERAMLSNLSFC